MTRSIAAAICFAVLTFHCSFAAAQAPDQGVYYDLGVFAYEAGDYEEALTHFERALEARPKDPYVHHFLGKTCMALGRDDEAKSHLETASGIDPEIPELQYDMGMLYAEMEDYERAAETFNGIVASEPGNVRARYQAGINQFRSERFRQAVDHFIVAGENSPTLTDNSFYYAGVCYYKLKELDKAAAKFAYVRDNAASQLLRGNARVWLQNINRRRQSLKRFRLFFKLGRQWDDNVRLEPLDLNLFSDESDFLTLAYLSGSYNRRFGKEDHVAVRAGYSHYQTLHDDLDEYDLTASLADVAGEYRFDRLSFGLAYSPSYYWLDGDGYLLRHLITPRMSWRISENLTANASAGVGSDHYIEEDARDGWSGIPRIGFIYGMPDLEIRLLGHLAYEFKDADASHESYDRFQTEVGLTWKMFWDIDCAFSLSYEDRKYGDDHPFFGVVRNDDKFGVDLSLSRTLFYDWLGVSAEVDFTKNDSNIKDNQYERTVAGISVFVVY